MELIFCMQINIKVSTSWHYFFDASGPTCPGYSKWEVSNIFAISKVKIILMKLIFCMQTNIFLQVDTNI